MKLQYLESNPWSSEAYANEKGAACVYVDYYYHRTRTQFCFLQLSWPSSLQRAIGEQGVWLADKLRGVLMCNRGPDIVLILLSSELWLEWP